MLSLSRVHAQLKHGQKHRYVHASIVVVTIHKQKGREAMYCDARRRRAIQTSIGSCCPSSTSLNEHRDRTPSARHLQLEQLDHSLQRIAAQNHFRLCQVQVLLHLLLAASWVVLAEGRRVRKFVNLVECEFQPSTASIHSSKSTSSGSCFWSAAISLSDWNSGWSVVRSPRKKAPHQGSVHQSWDRSFPCPNCQGGTGPP